jgi:hypothetical protein
MLHFPYFMEIGGSLPRLQQPATCLLTTLMGPLLCHQILTVGDCLLPGRAKDLSALRC